jgi:tripartite-type tricarboxylate transporter receptor subunit TctC
VAREFHDIQSSPRRDVVARLRVGGPKAGVPAPVIARLNKELNVALALADVNRRLANEGDDALRGTPADCAADIDKDEKKWSAPVHRLDVKVK